VRRLGKISRRSVPALRIIDFNTTKEIEETAISLKKKYKKAFDELSKL
jgi:hypothetical protein